MTDVKLIKEPTIIVIAESRLDQEGIAQLTEWLKERDPACLPDEGAALFPQLDVDTTDNESLTELSGRLCYLSFGAKAGRKTNAEYIANLYGKPGGIFHASVLYHAKMTFFFAGISRRVTHELIRHYVGADRNEEGSPSQESTRYTLHPGWFSVHPRDVGTAAELDFKENMQTAYASYLAHVENAESAHVRAFGRKPVGMARKRIYESAAHRLPWAACTSMLWTTNAVALSKMLRERCDGAADLEFQRFARALRAVSHERWPNLFAESNPAIVDTRHSQIAQLEMLLQQHKEEKT